jgi:hypothetical protein
MPKSHSAPNPDASARYSVPHARKYLSWLSDPEFIGLDDDNVEQTCHIAFGHKHVRYTEGYND